MILWRADTIITHDKGVFYLESVIITCRHKNIHHPLHEEICSDCLAQGRRNETQRHYFVFHLHETRILKKNRIRNSLGREETCADQRRMAEMAEISVCPESHMSTCHHWTSLSSRASEARDPRTCTRTRKPPAETRVHSPCRSAASSLSALRWRICGKDWLDSEWILTEE